MKTYTRVIKTAVTEEVTAYDVLTKTLEQVERLGPETFDMGSWANDGNGRTASLGNLVKGLPHFDVNNCGTTACLAGHMASACNVLDVQGLSTYSGDIESELRDMFGDSIGDSNPFSDLPNRWPATMRKVYDDARRAETPRKGAEWLAAVAFLKSWLADNDVTVRFPNDIGVRMEDRITAHPFTHNRDMWWAVDEKANSFMWTWATLASWEKREADGYERSVKVGYYHPNTDTWITNVEDLPAA
jgi:hypothetical protein